MLTEVAAVVAAEPDGLWVATERQSACQKCQAKRGCGQKLLTRHLGETAYIKALFETQADASRHWKVGEEVVIGIEEQAFLHASLLSYLLPLVSMLLTMFIAHEIVATEFSSIIGAALGLLLGGTVVKFMGSKMSKRSSSCFQVKVVSQVNISQRRLIASQ